MKIPQRETRGQSHTPCWFPNRRKATRRRVSNPDCAADAPPHSRREQDRLLTAPSVLAGTLDCARARWQALFSGNTRLWLTCKPVTDSRLSLNQRWFCRIGLNLLAQVSDVDTQVLSMLLGFWAPDFAQDMAMRENAPRMFHE